MSAFRRWLDPIQSRFIHQMTHTQLRLPTRNPIELWLSFDDAYSYLLVQLLPKLISQLKHGHQYLRVYVAHSQPTSSLNTPAQPNAAYVLQDAAALAEQHRLIFFDPTFIDATQPLLIPSTNRQQQAVEILRHSPLTGEDYVHLLIQVFHMLWQKQDKKLALLSKKSTLAQPNQHKKPIPQRIKNQTIYQGYWYYAGQKFGGFDGFIALTQQLKHSQLLKSDAVFLINHIEWGEKIINDPEDITDIHEKRAELEVFVALEDPYSYLALTYLHHEVAAYYHIKLKLRLLPYQQRDHFNWSHVASLAKNMGIEFAPFCRPNKAATLLMARTIYADKKHQRIETALKLMQAAWAEAADLQPAKTCAAIAPESPPVKEKKVLEKLNKNQAILADLHQPYLPTFRLTITRPQHVYTKAANTKTQKRIHCQVKMQPNVFSGINRLWRVQTELAKTLAME